MTCFYCRHFFDCDHTDATCEKRIAAKKASDESWNKWAAERQKMYGSLPAEETKHHKPLSSTAFKRFESNEERLDYFKQLGEARGDKTPQIKRRTQERPFLTAMGIDQVHNGRQLTEN